MRLLAAPLALAIFSCGGAAISSSRTITLGEKDAGTTIHARVGDTVRLQLVDSFPVPGSSLVWDVTTTDRAVLSVVTTDRTQQVRSGPGGSDTYTATFNAGGAGQAVLNANGATTCEAMAKQSCPDRNFTITVVVAS
jgi:hypothetical protein